MNNNPNPIPKHTAELGSEAAPKNKNTHAVIIRILFLLFIIIYCYLLISYKNTRPLQVRNNSFPAYCTFVIQSSNELNCKYGINELSFSKRASPWWDCELNSLFSRTTYTLRARVSLGR